MLFQSTEFILYFLPLIFVGFLALRGLGFVKASKVYLVIGSLVFYGWWELIYLGLLIPSILINYVSGRILLTWKEGHRRLALLIAVLCANLGVLIYFKYYNFFADNVNFVLGSSLPLFKVILPLGISFFTFQQIAYVVDCYRGKSEHYALVDYALFICFFPHLIAGPIVHHAEIVPQFGNKLEHVKKHFLMGAFIFLIGIVKKVGIADAFAGWANSGFKNSAHLGLFEGWATSLSYTIQLYFDFSGYSDMAIGLALIFNVHFPMNFNSPYKSLNIQDFWRRWHITLGRFLSEYVYVPLGGNRSGLWQTCRNTLITFFLAGIWHGAGWTFLLWGTAHGIALVIFRLWQQSQIKMPKVLAWFLTFNFVNAAWVLFRAENLTQAVNVFKSMLGLHGIVLDPVLFSRFSFLVRPGIVMGNWFSNVGHLDRKFILFTFTAFVILLFMKNSVQKLHKFDFTWRSAFLLAAVTILAVNVLMSGAKASQFLYFNF
jgi:alginate O-acetyltransferase complex protein AlgI